MSGGMGDQITNFSLDDVIPTHQIYSTAPATTSVNIPGTGTSSLRIGAQAQASGTNSIALGAGGGK